MKQVDLDHPPAGTYFNTGDAARRGFRLNRFCYDFRYPANREAYKRDTRAHMDAYHLSEEERRLVDAGDWIGLIRYGVNLFVLLRLAELHGDGLTAVGAKMRGESVAQYLAGRGLAQAPDRES